MHVGMLLVYWYMEIFHTSIGYVSFEAVCMVLCTQVNDDFHTGIAYLAKHL